MKRALRQFDPSSVVISISRYNERKTTSGGGDLLRAINRVNKSRYAWQIGAMDRHVRAPPPSGCLRWPVTASHAATVPARSTGDRVQAISTEKPLSISKSRTRGTRGNDAAPTIGSGMDKAAYLDFVIDIIRRSDDQKGFQVLPRFCRPLSPRWVKAP